MQSLQAFSTSLEEANTARNQEHCVHRFAAFPFSSSWHRITKTATWMLRFVGLCFAWITVQPWRVVDQQRGGSRQNLALTGGAASSPFLLQLMVLGIAWALRVMVLSALSAASGHSQNFNTVFSPAVRLEAIQQIVRKQGKSGVDELSKTRLRILRLCV